jgi:hypothetical protein
MVRFTLAGSLAILLAAAVPAGAQQQPPLAAPCEDAAIFLTEAERRYCFAIAQAVAAAQPMLGILIAQGNPTPGSAAPAGVRLPGLPRLSGTVQLGAVHARLPDIRTQQAAPTARLEHLAPALSATATAELFQGFTVAPGYAGVGSVSLLGSGVLLPFNIVNVEGLAADAAEVAWGAGARLGLLQESFVAPAASVSLMYRRLGQVSYGDVCPAGAGADIIGGTGRGYDFAAGLCGVRADPGEFAFDLASWSGRLAVSKRLFGLGLAAGAGYDRFDSNVAFGLGAAPTLPVIGTQPVYVRGDGLRLEQDRRSAFLNAAYTLRLTTINVEAGWVQGGRAIEGFDAAASRFNPRGGAFFGSVGGRVAF